MPHSAKTLSVSLAAWLLPAFLLLSFIPFAAHADEKCKLLDGTTKTCTGAQVCCDGFTGQGPQCIEGSQCPAASQVNHQSAGTANPGGVSGTANTGGSAGTVNKAGVPGTSNSGGGKQTLQNPLKGVNSLEDLLNAILGAVVRLGSIALVIALVWVGAQFVFAQGNEEKLRSARSALMWTVIGGLVLLGAQAISMVIQTTAGALQ